jgi:energy-coupling factor transporter ATP-binding protein EcfA2
LENNALVVKGVDVLYGDVQALWDVSLEVKQGTIVSLVGANGAGKSTLLKTISGINRANKGEILFSGKSVTHLKPQEVVERFISEIESEMVVTLGRIPCSARLLSIKGLGVVSVAGLIGEVGDFSKFTTQSEIINLAGLDLYEVSSGKRKGQRRITKRGRSLMRKILYFAVVHMIGKHGIMHEYYERLTGRGTLRMRALVAAMRKLLRIIHAMMRDNRDYVGQYEAPRWRVIKRAA